MESAENGVEEGFMIFRRLTCSGWCETEYVAPRIAIPAALGAQYRLHLLLANLLAICKCCTRTLVFACSRHSLVCICRPSIYSTQRIFQSPCIPCVLFVGIIPASFHRRPFLAELGGDLMAAASGASSAREAKNKTRSMCRSSSSSSVRGPVIDPPFIGERCA